MSSDAWDALTPAQRERVVWLAAERAHALGPGDAEDACRWAVNAYAQVVDLVPGRYTSKAFLEDQRVRSYDQGWDDGHQAGKDEALDAIEQLAKAASRA